MQNNVSQPLKNNDEQYKTIQVLHLQNIINLCKLHTIYYFLDVEYVENINEIKNAAAAFLLRDRTDILRIKSATQGWPISESRGNCLSLWGPADTLSGSRSPIWTLCLS